MAPSRAGGENPQSPGGRRPRGVVRDALVAAGLELARQGGPDAVVLRDTTRMVGVVPNAAYRHFADRDELLAAVCTEALRELAARMADGIGRVRGKHGDPSAAGRRLQAIGTAYLAFAREEPGLFATAFALPQQHTYWAGQKLDAGNSTTERARRRVKLPGEFPASSSQAAHYGVSGAGFGHDDSPLGLLRTALDELVVAGVLQQNRRDGLEYPIWSAVHGLAVLTGRGPLRDLPDSGRHRLEALTLAFIGEGLA